MSDTYQAVYDAVRSRIGNCDVGQAVSDAAFRAFDISHAISMLRDDFAIATYEMRRPSVLMRPSLTMDGNQWCMLYGDNLHDGIAGFGDTPALAAEAFDVAWNKERAGPANPPNEETK